MYSKQCGKIQRRVPVVSDFRKAMNLSYHEKIHLIIMSLPLSKVRVHHHGVPLGAAEDVLNVDVRQVLAHLRLVVPIVGHAVRLHLHRWGRVDGVGIVVHVAWEGHGPA